MSSTYNPLEFVGQIEILTLTIIGSFITMKFLNIIFDNLYQPVMDTIINSDLADKYYLRIGKYYVQADTIIKEFIKWFVIIILLMIFHNIYTQKYKMYYV